jgi:hypothetical protein
MKKHTKSFALILTILFVSTLFFSSCSKDDANAKSTLMNHDWELTTIETDDEAITEFFEITYSLVKTTYQFGNYSVSPSKAILFSRLYGF